MAIKVVPQEETFQESRWLSLLFIAAIILFLLTFVSYFLILTFTGRAKQNIKNLEATLAGRTQEESALEERVLTYHQKIKDFTPLLEDHKEATKLLAVLEGVTHPRVRFTELKFDSRSATLALKGQTENFQTLAQQQVLFEQSPAFKEVNLGEVALAEGGRVKFNLSLVLDPQLLTGQSQ